MCEILYKIAAAHTAVKQNGSISVHSFLQVAQTRCQSFCNQSRRTTHRFTDNMQLQSDQTGRNRSARSYVWQICAR